MIIKILCSLLIYCVLTNGFIFADQSIKCFKETIAQVHKQIEEQALDDESVCDFSCLNILKELVKNSDFYVDQQYVGSCEKKELERLRRNISRIISTLSCHEAERFNEYRDNLVKEILTSTKLDENYICYAFLVLSFSRTYKVESIEFYQRCADLLKHDSDKVRCYTLMYLNSSDIKQMEKFDNLNIQKVVEQIDSSVHEMLTDQKVEYLAKDFLVSAYVARFSFEQEIGKKYLNQFRLAHEQEAYFYLFLAYYDNCKSTEDIFDEHIRECSIPESCLAKTYLAHLLMIHQDKIGTFDSDLYDRYSQLAQQVIARIDSCSVPHKIEIWLMMLGWLDKNSAFKIVGKEHISSMHILDLLEFLLKLKNDQHEYLDYENMFDAYILEPLQQLFLHKDIHELSRAVKLVHNYLLRYDIDFTKYENIKIYRVLEGAIQKLSQDLIFLVDVNNISLEDEDSFIYKNVYQLLNECCQRVMGHEALLYNK